MGGSTCSSYSAAAAGAAGPPPKDSSSSHSSTKVLNGFGFPALTFAVGWSLVLFIVGGGAASS